MNVSKSLTSITCLLFVPGNRPERYAKAIATGSAAIVIDLEDAVPPGDKSAARQAAIAFLHEARPAGGPLVMVRINALGTRAGLDDLAALADGTLAPDALLLPKIEHPRDIEIIRQHDPHADTPARPIMAAIESARGLDNASAIAAHLAPSDALAFGGADLAADLGSTMDWEALAGPRSVLVRAAAIGRVPVFDVPTLDIAAIDVLTKECARVRAMGFSGKLAIHPAQVAPIQAAFAPTADEIARAQRIVDAYRMAGGGAVSVDGRMIDGPVVDQAHRILGRAQLQQ